MQEDISLESNDKESDYLIEPIIIIPGRKTEFVKPLQIPIENLEQTKVEIYATIIHNGQLYEYRKYHNLIDLMGNPRLVIRKELPPEIKKGLE